MSYDGHITRKTFWVDPEGPEISMAEWLAVVRADPEMEADGYNETRQDDGSVLRTEREAAWLWTAYSHNDESDREAWFVYRDGEIVVKYPDAEVIGKMWSIAQALSAKVQGDDGEIYDASGNKISEVPLRVKPWWRFW